MELTSGERQNAGVGQQPPDQAYRARCQRDLPAWTSLSSAQRSLPLCSAVLQDEQRDDHILDGLPSSKAKPLISRLPRDRQSRSKDEP